ncbi:S-layer homology domain-containing protein [Sporosarcina sp. ACRSM]|uniref:S-layer homology domain-containing protein n=1 Tax=Sporosarcina sp. ACRSM TaxID=2918216 RepID=UPI001EF5384B|nr:S-layer homology domain-containing protein [Sporosarcina sp. ACRSM]MCG7336871.1 S-layer homology domain-containing protein [Sporosarcina sp. ACRSM]
MRFVKVLASIFILFALLIPTKADAATKFKDVSQDFWAAEQIYQFTDKGVIRGYEDGTFRPNQHITRAQAASILTRVLQLETENLPPIDYKDIKKSYSSYNAIAAITNAGIMQGNNGNFKPNDPLTRAQMATILTNAFELKGNKTAAFKDVPKEHSAYAAIDAIFANQVTTGYQDQTFKPGQPTTRAQFVTFLSRSIDQRPSVSALLKKAYANEQTIDAYEFDGNVKFGLTLPETLNSPETGMIMDMLKDIKIDVTGAYQKDPMMLEANVALTLSGDMQTTISMPIVMTEDTMWFKLPNTPLAPLPEELVGKYIEFDLKELQELEGQPAGSLDIDLQTELALAINQLFVDQFADDFYNAVESDALTVPNEIDVKQVVKFELTNESLQPFVERLMTGFLPQFFELVQDPQYMDALGLTIEDIQAAQEGIKEISANIEEIVQQINQVVSINTFEQYVVIDQNDFIAYDLMNLDLDITVDEETFGIKISSTQSKSNINGNVPFAIGIPNAADVITSDELEKLFEIEYEDELEAINPELEIK